MKTMPQKRDAVEAVQSSYQPSKAELEEDVSIDATLDDVAEAMLQGGAERRGPEGRAC